MYWKVKLKLWKKQLVLTHQNLVKVLIGLMLPSVKWKSPFSGRPFHVILCEKLTIGKATAVLCKINWFICLGKPMVPMHSTAVDALLEVIFISRGL